MPVVEIMVFGIFIFSSCVGCHWFRKSTRISKLGHLNEEKYSGLYETLRNLTKAKDLSIAESQSILKEINSSNGHVFVAILDSQIIYKQQVSRDVTRIETEKDSKKSVALAFSIL